MAYAGAEFEEVFVCDDGLFARGKVQEGDDGADAAGYGGLSVGSCVSMVWYGLGDLSRQWIGRRVTYAKLGEGVGSKFLGEGFH